MQFQGVQGSHDEQLPRVAGVIHSALGWRRRAALAAVAVSVVAAGAMAPQAAMAQPGGLPDFTELVDKVGPSVVNIRTTEKVRTAAAGGGDISPDMQEFFRRFGIPLPGQPSPQAPGRRGQTPQKPQPQQEPDDESQQKGVGSGFILNADGYVMTNAHVVDGADEVIVTLTDKREYKARIIGADKRTDVALVKIDASGLPAVRTGDVSRLKVGEWVMAIGSPFGLDNTVTAGIVSAKARDTGDFLPFIQTDVAINPGNSGGPLINMRGEVVGINSQIYSRSGGFMGISFAIPIDEALRVSEQLRASGRVVRGRIGVQIDQVSKEVAESIGLGKPQGALVKAVEAGGPAEKAGVEAGDIITKVDGKAVDKAGDLPRIIGAMKPGSKATLQVFRRGANRDLSVSIVELEPEQKTARAAADRPVKPAPGVSALGLTVSDLSEAQKRDLRLRGGVHVDAVDGAAGRAGLHEDDVILAVDKTEVLTAKQFEAAMAKVDKAKPVTLLVRRGEWVNYVVVRPAR
jgi:serine protease Do